MKNWIDSRWFQRILEIIPGFSVWVVIIFPFILAYPFPLLVAYFILIFNLYWFLKALNIARHLLNGLYHMQYNMRTDWYEKATLASKDLKSYLKKIEKEYKDANGGALKRIKMRDLKNEIDEIRNLDGRQELVKNIDDIVHLVIIPFWDEGFQIVDETFDHLRKSNYPSDKLIVVLTGEERDEKNYKKISKKIEEKYDGVFSNLFLYLHKDVIGEIAGKGANLVSAGRKVLKFVEKEGLNPENVLVTTLDSDHIVHKEYFSKLTYKYITSPDRARETYQPIALLFNNIWDAPGPNRVAAIASSFWLLVESMRPYRMRTFAAHTQSLKTLLITDFWSTQTIVEDGHQYFRTYFAFNGDIEMVPLLVPVYQDCVLDKNIYQTFKSQYLQRRRWAWGASDFAFVVKNFLKHPEIPLREKTIQTFRQYISHLSWASSSLLLATAWIPILFNQQFMDSVIAHNVTRYSGRIALFAWIGVFFSVWTYLRLLPQKPERYSSFRYVGMFFQWIFTPVVAIILSSFPSIDAQTRLMFGKYLGWFITPKIRKSKVIIDK